MVHPDYFGRTAGPERSLSEDLSARIVAIRDSL
jgi:hypothetical protein